MHEFVSAYYGIDLLAMLMTFMGIYYLGNQNRFGFIAHILGNILWFTLGIMTQSIGLIVANIAFVLMSMRGYWKWRDSGASG